VNVDEDIADRRRRSRALVTALVLAAFVVLMYAISIVKLTGK